MFILFFLEQVFSNTPPGPDEFTCNFHSRSVFHSNQDQVNISSLLLNRSLVIDVKGILLLEKSLLKSIKTTCFLSRRSPRGILVKRSGVEAIICVFLAYFRCGRWQDGCDVV